MKLKLISVAVCGVMCAVLSGGVAAQQPEQKAVATATNESAFSVYDSQIYGLLFNSPEMRAVFNDEKLLSYWLQYERELAKAQAQHGVIPAEAAQKIAEVAIPSNVNRADLKTSTRKVGRPVDGLVKQIRKLDPLAQKYVHFGSTTQDVMDTATVLQIRDGIDVIQGKLKAVILRVADLAEKYADTPMIARTNGQDAIPSTYGMHLASYLAELNRNAIRLEQAKERVCVGQFGSAVGTMSSAGDKALKVRATLMKNLGLSVADFPWNASRDNYAETVQVLALINGTLGRIATDLNLWSRTADNSISEGEGGPSSTMPQKRNPRAAEFIGGLTAMARIRATGAMEMLEQSEVRQGAPWISEWSTIPEMFMITATSLDRADAMFTKLIVRPDVMLERFGDSQHYTMAEAVQQFLVPKVGLGKAHSMLVKAIKNAPKGTPFEDVLKTDPELKKVLSEQDIAFVLNPKNYLGQAKRLVNDCVTKVKRQNR